MSKGAGIIETRIANLFAATRDRALGIDDIVDNAYGLKGAKPTRAQRLSATRAAHRVLKRVRDTEGRGRKLINEAHAKTEAALGLKPDDPEYQKLLETVDEFREGRRLLDFCNRIGTWSRLLRVEGKRGVYTFETDFWCTTTMSKRLYFHPPDVPVRVWAVSIQQNGVVWAEAEVIKVTERNVMVRYAGEIARLDRDKLWHWWAMWRGVRFVSSRTGRIASELDNQWWQRYGARGAIPPSMQMPLADAMALLGVPSDYTRDDVISAFKKAAKRTHPDAGGTAEAFQKAVDARDRLLAALGTKAPAPKMPTYSPKGSRVIYRRGRIGSGQRRLGSSTRRIG
ncbi:hypothetical protein AB7M49_006611 [Bradyrhizobium elkanii]